MVEPSFPNFGYSNVQRNLIVVGNSVMPVNILSQTPVQPPGSILFDPQTLKLYYSDGSNWIELSTGSGSNVTLSSAGGGFSLVVDGVGPDLSIRGLTAGPGISMNNMGGEHIVSNTAPDQTVVLNEGAGILIAGTYPNFTISAAGVGLAPTLVVGNTTGGTDIVISTGDEIVGETDVTVRGVNSSGGTGGTVNIEGGDDSGAGDGGDVNISSGSTVSGTPGNVNIISDGDINLSVPPSGSINIGEVLTFGSTSVQTTDATTTLLQTIPLSTPDRIYSLKSNIIARSGAIGATYELVGAFHRDGGTTVRQIASTVATEIEEDNSWNVVYVVAASAVEVRVTGVALTTIDWKIVATLFTSN